MILIIGAGLAGLSTAYHLNSLPTRVFEKEKDAGGLCRSYHKDGFTFDYTGHLLHFRRAEIKALVEQLLGRGLARHTRRSYIYSHGTFTEYPFQVNTFGLPPEVVRECLLGFVATLTPTPAIPITRCMYDPLQEGDNGSPGNGSPGREGEASFKEWIIENLGEGFAKHFMVPFNEKLWQVSLDELTSDWVSWLIPKPELKDVVNGALGIKDKAFGYNPSFLYPIQGGIASLPKAFLPGVPRIEYGCELIEVDTGRKRATFQDGRVEPYETLVSTIPVSELVRRCTDLPAEIREAAAGLRCASVYNVNLGVARERISDKHWIYFPEAEYPFYRVGFPMNFAPSLGPSGCSSMYVEVSHQASRLIAPADLLNQVRRGLERAGILHPDDDIVVADILDIRYAYVLFDRHRARAIPAILSELERRGIHSIGRYGRWEHTSMEDAILQGRSLAERLRH
jgi:protoporphyrinogen oxidase